MDDTFDFVVVLKNARSLSSDERMAELLEEVQDAFWDVILVNETWRVEQEEHFELECGHLWFGSGGAKKKNSNM
eukprot:2722377-Karenia_brevis.AAC.1